MSDLAQQALQRNLQLSLSAPRVKLSIARSGELVSMVTGGAVVPSAGGLAGRVSDPLGPQCRPVHRRQSSQFPLIPARLCRRHRQSPAQRQVRPGGWEMWKLLPGCEGQQTMRLSSVRGRTAAGYSVSRGELYWGQDLLPPGG